MIIKILHSKRDSGTILGVVAIILTIIIAIFTVWWTNPVNISVWDNISNDNNTLIIHIKNNEPFAKNTGIIQFYRLNIDPYNPYNLEDSLNAREEKEYYFPINITYFDLDDVNNNCVTLPAEILSATKNNSIAYKIDCDKCPYQGIIRRYPYQNSMLVDFRLKINKENFTISRRIPIFSWGKEYSLDEIKEIDKIRNIGNITK